MNDTVITQQELAEYRALKEHDKWKNVALKPLGNGIYFGKFDIDGSWYYDSFTVYDNSILPSVLVNKKPTFYRECFPLGER